MGVLLLAVIALGVWTGYQAKLARDDLAVARSGVERLTAAVSQGQTGEAQEALFDVQDATESAAAHTDGPGWSVGALLPMIGDDVDAVRTVADVSDNVAQDVLPGLVEASGALNPRQLQPQDGQISIDGLEAAAPPLAEANAALGDEVARVDALQPDEMLSAVAGPVRDLQTALDDAVDVTDRAATAADLLPTMLGGDGAAYLPADVPDQRRGACHRRDPGALAVIHAADGQIQLERQGVATRLRRTVLEARAAADQRRARRLQQQDRPLPRRHHLQSGLPARRRGRPGHVGDVDRPAGRRRAGYRPGGPVVPARGHRSDHDRGPRRRADDRQRGRPPAQRCLSRPAKSHAAEPVLRRRRP